MKQGYLSQYFDSIAIKRLKAVEADPKRSNQHEFNGVVALQKMFGIPEGTTKYVYKSRFIYLSDETDAPVIDEGILTWYNARVDARYSNGKPRSPEYRLYYPTNEVSKVATEGDLLIVAKLPDVPDDYSLLVIVAKRGSTIEQQLLWLFGYTDQDITGFDYKTGFDETQEQSSFAVNFILEFIGIEIEQEEPDYLEEMLRKFGGQFPKSIEFSEYARGTLKDIHAKDNPDSVLLLWMEREEILFRTLEKHILKHKLAELQQLGEIDPDAYMQLAMSFMQRRKSRAGSAFENHLGMIFTEHGIAYSRTAVTENKLKPDFIFPNIKLYHTPSFPEARLTMLAAKTTCKDRWRQIRNEAARIQLKHLITIEPGISENQTNEMQSEQVQLIVPEPLHSTYKPAQKPWLMQLQQFLGLVESRQS